MDLNQKRRSIPDNLAFSLHLLNSRKKGSNWSQITHPISENLSYLEYSFCLSESEDVIISSINEEGFYFLHCWKGTFTLAFENGEEKTINPFHNAIIFDGFTRVIKLKLKKEINYKFCIIGFNKPATSAKELLYSSYYRFKVAYCEQIRCTTFMYLGKQNLRLLDKINILSRMSKEGIASELIMEGLIYEILGLKMQQMMNSINSKQLDNGTLTCRDIEQIQDVSSYIKKNPSLDYTIKFLCTKTGLSPAKLQEGFKKMHNKTAINFIRNIRLEKSAELMEKTDMNISQIVYSIGLTSRSYFSKIFKKRYNCSPKYFREQYKSLISKNSLMEV